jgi:hypothetical protein
MSLGIGSIAIGGLMLLSSVFFELALAATKWLGGDVLMQTEGVSGFAEYQLRHHVAFSLFQCAFGAVTVLVGIGVLRRRPWARWSLEALAWLSLVMNLVVGPLLVQSYSGASPFMFLFMLVGGVLVTIALTIATFMVIKYLRSPGVRQALSAEGGRTTR